MKRYLCPLVAGSLLATISTQASAQSTSNVDLLANNGTITFADFTTNTTVNDLNNNSPEFSSASNDAYFIFESDNVIATADFDSGGISTGDVVDSYLLHFDPNAGRGLEATGTITIQLAAGETLFGSVSSASDLIASDAAYGDAETIYGDLAEYRAGEAGDGFDITSAVGPDGLTTLTIDYDLTAGSGALDQFRVFTGTTAAIPEPSSALLISLGGVSLMLRRRRA